MSIDFDSLFSHPLDLSWVITAVIAIAAFLSPVAVALINNHHAYKMKKLEFCHEENMKKLSLSHEAAQKQFEIYYADKKTAFSEVLRSAGNFTASKQSLERYQNVHSAVDTALLFCDSQNQKTLISFMDKIDNEVFGSGSSREERTMYSSLIASLGCELNKELTSTKQIVEHE